MLNPKMKSILEYKERIMAKRGVLIRIHNVFLK